MTRIEMEASEAALGRLQTETLANAQYRFQRQQREQMREKKRQDMKEQEKNFSSSSRPSMDPRTRVSASSLDLDEKSSNYSSFFELTPSEVCFYHME